MAIGDNPKILYAKRRWLQQGFDAGRISGKASRELRDLYSKKNIGKLQQQRRLAHNLGDAAKAAKQRLEEAFEQTSSARPVASAVGQSLGNSPRNSSVGMPADSQVVDDTPDDTPDDGPDDSPNDEAADLVAGVHIKSEHAIETEVETLTETDTETKTKKEDDNSSDEDDLTSDASQARAIPTNTAEDSDVIARQRVLELGLELFDPSLADQDTAKAFGGIVGSGGVRIKEEEVDKKGGFRRW